MKYANDEMQMSSGGGSFVIGALCGAAIGAAVGLLFAPRSGAEMRQQLAHQTQRFRRTASDAYDSASQMVNDAVARGREAVEVGREAYNKTRPNGGASESTIG